MTDQSQHIALDPAIAELIYRAEQIIEHQKGWLEAEEAARQAELDAYLARQTSLLLDELGNEIPAALRPYCKANDCPYADERSDDWRPLHIKFEVPGLDEFHAHINLDRNLGRYTVKAFYSPDCGNYRGLDEALTASRNWYLYKIEQQAKEEEKQALSWRAYQAEQTPHEQLAALIKQIVVDEVRQLMEV